MEAEVEVPAGDVAVLDGVRAEFRDDQHDRVVRVGAVRDAPRVQTDGRQAAGEAAPRGVEVKRIPKVRAGLTGVMSVGLMGFVVTPLTVPSVA
ncbi:hypothetical protein SHKM778_23770 [Streptomyces sp. KM77-8]|uniref:Uncharacterized protein n=1 Tax=Streptomyces haneummycinicus TaxID=3074435 RepID=A0AAT9HEU4_9ACTN